MTFHLIRRNGRTIIDSETLPGDAILDGCKAKSWVCAKLKFGFRLTSIQSVMCLEC